MARESSSGFIVTLMGFPFGKSCSILHGALHLHLICRTAAHEAFSLRSSRGGNRSLHDGRWSKHMPYVKAQPNEYLVVGRGGKITSYGQAASAFIWPGSSHVLIP